jgi:hypothetical protein
MPNPVKKPYIHEEFNDLDTAMVWVNKQCAVGTYRLHTIWQFNSIRVVLVRKEG